MHWLEIKGALYIYLAAFGAGLMWAGHQLSKTGWPPDFVAAAVLFITGLVAVLFALATYAARDDWEIWS